MNDNEINVSEQEVVEPVTEPTTATEADTVEGEQAQPQETAEPAKPKQTAEDNAAFAAMRRQLEAERIKATRLERIADGYRNGVKAQGYEGETHEDIVARLNAEAQGVPVEQFKAQQQKQADDAARNEREIAQQIEIDTLKLKMAYPDLKINSVMELPDEFKALMATGRFTPDKAYATMKAAEELQKKPVPPSIGSLKSSVPMEKEFYTNDEIDNLTPKQLDDPKIYEKAMKSLSRLKK